MTAPVRHAIRRTAPLPWPPSTIASEPSHENASTQSPDAATGFPSGPYTVEPAGAACIRFSATNCPSRDATTCTSVLVTSYPCDQITCPVESWITQTPTVAIPWPPDCTTTARSFVTLQAATETVVWL